jgi:sRNA-binding carbon storage regulator CsrA
MSDRPGNLVLTRDEGTSVYIDVPGGERIVVHVLDIRSKQVELMFTASKSVRIERDDAKVKTPRGDKA